MPWLDSQTPQLLRDWLRRTNAPMLASSPDGGIFWCNHALERLLGYTSQELVKLTWTDLTPAGADLEADIKLVKELVAGGRTDYQLQKVYKTKNGPPERVVIDVVRYPLAGDFEFCLVTVFPINGSEDFALGQLSQIRELILELIKHQPDGLTFNKIQTWAAAHPVTSSVVGAILAYLLFGERVFEILERTFKFFTGPGNIAE